MYVEEFIMWNVCLDLSFPVTFSGFKYLKVYK